MAHFSYLVVGLGKTGASIARYLQRQNKPFAVFDTRSTAPNIEEFRAEFANISIYLEHMPHEVVHQLTDIIVSPGVPLDNPFFTLAKHNGVALYGDIECLARQTTAPIIAITGTNGKSTVTTLVGAMAQAAGFRVAVAGNIGTPVLDLLADEYQYDLWVLELSSFQLDLTYSLAPIAATILNISPDHLDRHHTLEAYINAKQRIYHKAKNVVFNKEDKFTFPNAECHPATNQISFSSNKPDLNNWGLIEQNNKIYLAKGFNCFLSADSLLIKGVHNWLNALAACALAETAGISWSSIVQVLKKFSGLPHRCQWIRTLDNVEWINDSKGTNVGATLSAINGIGGSMQGKIILIAGGQGKGADFNDLAESVTNYVRCIVLIGEDADKINVALAPIVPITQVESLETAVCLARKQALPGDVVLLSPACASLDMFCDFNHRGDVFISAVVGL